jgi:ferredoxin
MKGIYSDSYTTIIVLDDCHQKNKIKYINEDVFFLFMPYKITIDRNLCIACGAATVACPQLFYLADDNGKNRVIEQYSKEMTEDLSTGVVPDELYQCAKEGADVCPVQAITVEKVD